jgi:hypothetical protein
MENFNSPEISGQTDIPGMGEDDFHLPGATAAFFDKLLDGACAKAMRMYAEQKVKKCLQKFLVANSRGNGK